MYPFATFAFNKKASPLGGGGEACEYKKKELLH